MSHSKINLIGVSGKMYHGKDTLARMIQWIYAGHTSGNDLYFENPEYRDDFVINPRGVIDEPTVKLHCPYVQKAFSTKVKQVCSEITGFPIEKFNDVEFKKSYLPEQWSKWAIMVNSKGKDIETPFSVFNTKKEAQVELNMREILKRNDIFKFYLKEQKKSVRELMQEVGDGLRQLSHGLLWVNALFSQYTSDTHPIEDHLPYWIISDVRYKNEIDAITERGDIVIRVVRNDNNLPVSDNISETELDSYPFEHVIDNSTDTNSLYAATKELMKKLQLI